MGEQPRIPAESQSLNVLPTFGAPRVHRSVVLNPVPTDISQTEQQLLHPQVLSAGLPFGLLGLQPPGDSMLGLADVAPAFGGGLAGQSLTTMPGAISEDARKEAAAAARAARQQKRKEEKQRRDEKQRKQQPTFNNTASTEYNGRHPAGIMPSEVEHAAPLPGIGPSLPGPTMIQTSSIPPLMQMTSSPVVPQGLPLPIPIAAPLKAPAAPKDKSAARAVRIYVFCFFST